jgi:hypothetical protein
MMFILSLLVCYGIGRSSFYTKKKSEQEINQDDKKTTPLYFRDFVGSEPIFEYMDETNGRLPVANTMNLSKVEPLNEKPTSNSTIVNYKTLRQTKLFDNYKSGSFINERKTPIKNSDFEKTVKSAVSLIESGEFKKAGRVLNIILIHTNEQQKNRIIELVDPILEKQFQKAYIWRLYKPKVFRKILEVICTSELHILPSYKKACRLLEVYDDDVIRNRMD